MNKDEAIRYATKFLEDLLSFFGINVAVDSTCDDEVIQLEVPSTSLNSLLIGRNADNLRALQYIVSQALVSRGAEITRVNVDIADYKRARADRIAEKAEGWIAKVRDTGEPMTIELSPADRRVVHKFAEDYSDITTYSEGEGRERHLIIAKKAQSVQKKSLNPIAIVIGIVLLGTLATFLLINFFNNKPTDKDLEAEASNASIEQGNKEREEYPILAKLPIKNAVYTIGYQIEADGAPTITIDTTEFYLEFALKKLESLGTEEYPATSYRLRIISPEVGEAEQAILQKFSEHRL